MSSKLDPRIFLLVDLDEGRPMDDLLDEPPRPRLEEKVMLDEITFCKSVCQLYRVYDCTDEHFLSLSCDKTYT